MIMSGYDFLKSQVLSCWRKVESVCDVVISSGRVFQTRGPATVNARSPTVERLTDRHKFTHTNRSTPKVCNGFGAFRRLHGCIFNKTESVLVERVTTMTNTRPMSALSADEAQRCSEIYHSSFDEHGSTGVTSTVAQRSQVVWLPRRHGGHSPARAVSTGRPPDDGGWRAAWGVDGHTDTRYPERTWTRHAAYRWSSSRRSGSSNNCSQPASGMLSRPAGYARSSRWTGWGRRGPWRSEAAASRTRRWPPLIPSSSPTTWHTYDVQLLQLNFCRQGQKLRLSHFLLVTE